jgi:hypothetical protein
MILNFGSPTVQNGRLIRIKKKVSGMPLNFGTLNYKRENGQCIF